MNSRKSILLFALLGVTGLFSLSISNLNQTQGQNYSSITSKEFELIRTSLDQAIAAFNEGNLSGAYEKLEKTEDLMEMVESRIIFELGIE